MLFKLRVLFVSLFCIAVLSACGIGNEDSAAEDYWKATGAKGPLPSKYVFIEEDLNKDGVNEAVFGVLEKKGNNILSSVYLFTNLNKEPELLKEINEFGYIAKNLKLVSSTEGEKFFYYDLTNEANLNSFGLWGYRDNGFRSVGPKPSLTGSGADYLYSDTDSDPYEGYVENRWGYDVYNYSVTRVVSFAGNVESSVQGINAPDTPEEAAQMVISLIALSTEYESVDIDKGLDKYYLEKVSDNLRESLNSSEYKSIIQQNKFTGDSIKSRPGGYTYDLGDFELDIKVKKVNEYYVVSEIR